MYLTLVYVLLLTGVICYCSGWCLLSLCCFGCCVNTHKQFWLRMGEEEGVQTEVLTLNKERNTHLWQKCVAFYHVWLSLFGILTVFPTLLIDDSNNAHYIVFYISSWDDAKRASQSSAHCLSIAVPIFSLAVFQAISTLLCQLDLFFNRYFLLLAILRTGNGLYFPGCSGTSKLAFCGSIYIYCCGGVLNRSLPRSTYFCKRLFPF